MRNVQQFWITKPKQELFPVTLRAVHKWNIRGPRYETKCSLKGSFLNLFPWSHWFFFPFSIPGICLPITALEMVIFNHILSRISRPESGSCMTLTIVAMSLFTVKGDSSNSKKKREVKGCFEMNWGWRNFSAPSLDEAKKYSFTNWCKKKKNKIPKCTLIHGVNYSIYSKFFRFWAQGHQFSERNAESPCLGFQSSSRILSAIRTGRKGNPRIFGNPSFPISQDQPFPPKGSVQGMENSVGQGFGVCSFGLGFIVRINTHLHGEKGWPWLKPCPVVFFFLRSGHS